LNWVLFSQDWVWCGGVCCATYAPGLLVTSSTTWTVLVFLRLLLNMVDITALVVVSLVILVGAEQDRVSYDGYSGRVFSNIKYQI